MSDVNFEELLVDSSRVLADLAVERVGEDSALLISLRSVERSMIINYD